MPILKGSYAQGAEMARRSNLMQDENRRAEEALSMQKQSEALANEERGLRIRSFREDEPVRAASRRFAITDFSTKEKQSRLAAETADAVAPFSRKLAETGASAQIAAQEKAFREATEDIERMKMRDEVGAWQKQYDEVNNLVQESTRKKESALAFIARNAMLPGANKQALAKMFSGIIGSDVQDVGWDDDNGLSFTEVTPEGPKTHSTGADVIMPILAKYYPEDYGEKGTATAYQERKVDDFYKRALAASATARASRPVQQFISYSDKAKIDLLKKQAEKVSEDMSLEDDPKRHAEVKAKYDAIVAQINALGGGADPEDATVDLGDGPRPTKEDLDSIDWAQKHPKDPRSAKLISHFKTKFPNGY